MDAEVVDEGETNEPGARTTPRRPGRGLGRSPAPDANRKTLPGEVETRPRPAEDRPRTSIPQDTASAEASRSSRTSTRCSPRQQERDEYLELAKRTQADFENYRKRMAAEDRPPLLRGKAELAGGLIGVIDNLERALAAAGVEPGSDEAPAEPLAEGFFLTYRELCAALCRAGIEPFDPSGERFDPTAHEALQNLPAEGIEPGTVIEMMQKGYRLGEQLIRPARVVVSE